MFRMEWSREFGFYWWQHDWIHILENNLFQSSLKLNLGKNIVFQHDNDLKHIVHIVKNWLNKQEIELATIFTRYEFNWT